MDMDKWMSENMTPESIERAKAKAQDMINAIELAAIRKTAGLTQSDMAVILGVKQPTVQGYEKARIPSMKILRRYFIAAGYDDIQIVASGKKKKKVSFQLA